MFPIFFDTRDYVFYRTPRTYLYIIMYIESKNIL